MSILVVEDDVMIRLVLVRVLALAGHTVVEAADGQVALERLRSGARPPSLILLDLMMPGMDGATFRQEQLADPLLAAIPVVMMSGGSDLTQSVLRLGAAAMIPKPFDIIELLDVVARVLRQTAQQATDVGDTREPKART